MIYLVVSLLLYGLLFFTSERLSALVGRPHLITVLVLPVYVLLQIRGEYRRGNLKEHGIAGIRERQSVLFSMAPVLILPVVNVLSGSIIGGGLNAETLLREKWPEIFLTVYAGFCEEWLFRGILPAVLQKHFKMTRFCGICVSCICFAGLHMVNALSVRPAAFVWLQAAVALGAGLSFAGLTEKAGSIVPAAVLHILINLSSFERNEPVTVGPWQAVWLVLSAACGCYGIGLCLCSRRKKQHETLH